MSVTDGAGAANGRRRRGTHLIGPRHWALWLVPRPFLVLAVLVDGAAVAAVATTAPLYPITGRHLIWFAALAGLSALHLEVTRRVERLRELAAEGVPYVSLKSVWTFAGLLVLPPSLLAALIGITYAHSWWRVGRTILPHRSIFSASTVVLASAAGGAVLAVADPSGYPAVPAGWSGLGVIVPAAIARWAVNSAMVFVAMPLMNPATTWRQAWRAVFGTPGDDLIEFAALCYGVLVAALLTVAAPLVLILGLPLVMMHRGIQFEYAAQRDKPTGLLRLELWRELATKQLQRADRLGATVGYLFVRLDEVDEVDASLAEVTEDRIGKLVADAVRAGVRDTDLVGRLPGAYDFAVLVADVPDGGLVKIAERIRDAVKATATAVDGRAGGLTVSIGGASYPSPARTLTELMTCADNALILAKSFVRDEIWIVGPDTPADAR